MGVDKTIIMYALYSGWTDFEDAVQAQVAIENNIDAVITRNTKDYKKLKEIQKIYTLIFRTDFLCIIVPLFQEKLNINKN